VIACAAVDPPTIIIASRGGLTFNDFLVHSLPLTVILVAAPRRHGAAVRIRHRRRLRRQHPVHRGDGPDRRGPRARPAEPRVGQPAVVGYGLVVTFASLAVAWRYGWLRYFALA
jgi:Na+/H+ antiporter NhaD/arsenite permease-like protein